MNIIKLLLIISLAVCVNSDTVCTIADADIDGTGYGKYICALARQEAHNSAVLNARLIAIMNRLDISTNSTIPDIESSSSSKYENNNIVTLLIIFSIIYIISNAVLTIIY